ncbi:hypothetical protein LXL04_006715 [Taraxacum kok-saghyz]
MAGEEVDPERIDRLEQTLQQFQQSLQQITENLATLTTQARNNQPIRGRQNANRAPNNRLPVRNQDQVDLDEDSDIENDLRDEDARGGRLGRRRDAADFDYRQRAKDVPSFNGSMNIEDFLDWMSELENFFQFYEIPMDKRVTLVAYKLKGGAQAWWKNLQVTRERQGKVPISSWERMERELQKRFLPPNHDQVLFNLFQNCAQGDRTVEVYTAEFHRLAERNDLSETESQQVSRYTNGLRPAIQDRISLVPVYTLDDAYNLAIRAESQLTKNSRGFPFASNRNKTTIGQTSHTIESSSNVAKTSTTDKGKSVANSPIPTLKSTNPYARPVAGKCYKCGVPGHRSSD